MYFIYMARLRCKKVIFTVVLSTKNKEKNK